MSRIARADSRIARLSSPIIGLTSPILSHIVLVMATDIHVWLPDDEAEALKMAASREARSVTNMARVFIRDGIDRLKLPSDVRAAQDAMEAMYPPKDKSP